MRGTTSSLRWRDRARTIDALVTRTEVAHEHTDHAVDVDRCRRLHVFEVGPMLPARRTHGLSLVHPRYARSAPMRLTRRLQSHVFQNCAKGDGADHEADP